MLRARDKNHKDFILEKVEITDAGSEGMGVGRVNDLVVFVPFVVPGDVADIRVIRRKKNFLEGRAVRFHKYSEDRVDAFCSHFGICGGCRWQNMSYEKQLFYKQKQVADSLQRIGKIDNPVILPILPSPETTYYRNKLEFTFSNHRWLTDGDMARDQGTINSNGAGFHIPQLFDRIVDIEHCYHQKDPSNAIRLTLRAFAMEKGLTFYDARKLTGFMRNLVIRTTRNGEVMVILVVRDDDKAAISGALDHLLNEVQGISSAWYVINPKSNDSLYDLEYHHYFGQAWITETMESFRPGGKEVLFRIGPASFFQTNTVQSGNLYRIAAEFAEFRGHEVVYDLYTGTGTIANYIAPYVQKVVGIETLPAAISDAEVNSSVNGNTNTVFVSGEVEKILTPEFIAKHGSPHTLITDPPRSGMHEKVVKSILETSPSRVVYVSCNPATQARDIALMSEKYELEKCRPVDMFPHTQHVENVALLSIKP